MLGMPEDFSIKKVLRTTNILNLVFFLMSVGAPKAFTQEIQPGVWVGSQSQALPLPTNGFQAYFVGEQHGLQENEEFQLDYLSRLNKTSHLRDVAIEEKNVYEDRAQAYIDGKSNVLPAELCLRANILRGIRHLNASLKEGERIRIHLIDIDSPAIAIREHLVDIGHQIPGAVKVSIPEASKIQQSGLETVAGLKQFHMDQRTLSELRTVEYSIRAYQQGFEVGVGPPKGSPYLEDREQAMADNLMDLIRTRPFRSILILCGFDHVSKNKRNDGGMDRNQSFSPMAMRIEQSGILTFSMVTFPLAGHSFWRGTQSVIPWQPSDGHLASGETLDKIIASAPQAKFIYIDAKRERVRLPSQDVSNYAVDAFLLFPSGTPMHTDCVSASDDEMHVKRNYR
jgi:hypothetical protein